MKNRFNVINVLFGTILEAKVSGHHDRDCMVVGITSFAFL
jgi:hypothetical protein